MFSHITGKILRHRFAIVLFFFSPVGLFLIFLIRIMSPFYLVRWGALVSSRIGHFAANVELYLCEIDNNINKPKQPYKDIHFLGEKTVCNEQLYKMWRRTICIGPSLFFSLLSELNRQIPGWKIHEIGKNTCSDRDVNNLLDNSEPHLRFTDEEIEMGEQTLRNYGIPLNAKIVCVIVRDNAYLATNSRSDYSYHDYRNCNIQNFTKAAEELAGLGYYVFRMGAKVESAWQTDNPKIIDYASNGMRTDFMDMYLGYKCTFCISTATGWDAIADTLFRKPTVFVNNVPLGIIGSYREKNIIITKHAILEKENRELSLSEIFDFGIGFSLSSSDFKTRGINLVENSPIEISEIVLEMHKRISNTWTDTKEDKNLQDRFWNKFLEKVNPLTETKSWHGKIKAKFGSEFLKNNPSFLL